MASESIAVSCHCGIGQQLRNIQKVIYVISRNDEWAHKWFISIWTISAIVSLYTNTLDEKKSNQDSNVAVMFHLNGLTKVIAFIVQEFL